MAGPEKPAAPAAAQSPLTVTQAAGLVSGALEKGLPARLHVIGEISGFNDRTHWYFRLKDEHAVLDCVMFAAAAKRAGFTPENGRKVVLSGRIEFYAKQGRTQFYAESMEAAGAGELEQRFRALCAELKALGWFEPERKRPTPLFPKRIAIVTSKTGAALQDVLVTMRRRCPAVEAAIVDVRVQGEGAAEEIARVIRWLSSAHEALGIDAVLVTRGGGSIEDLWAFNETAVARAIVESRVPVVAAIGHETDVTIAELVADARCATPTQAAMLLTPDREALGDEVEQASRRLGLSLRRAAERREDRMAHAGRRLLHALQQRVARAHVGVERLTARLARGRPETVLVARRARLAAADLERSFALAVERKRSRLIALERELVLAGPASVLARGYSVTTTDEGRIVRSVRDAPPASFIHTRVADGSFRSRVDAAAGAGEAPLRPAEALPPRLPARPPISRRRRPSSPDQMDLF